MQSHITENNSSSALISGTLEPLGDSYLQSLRMKDEGQNTVADELPLPSGGTHEHIYLGGHWNEV